MQIVVNIDVPTLAPAIDFYTAALGLRHQRTLDEDVAELVGAVAKIYLLEKPKDTATGGDAPDLRRYSRHWTPVHMDFVVENLAAARLQALNAGARQETECVEWRGSRCITFSDPFGHGFCLIEFSGDSYQSQPSEEAQAEQNRSEALFKYTDNAVGGA